MTYISQKEFMLEVAKGNVSGHSLLHKFGSNDAVSTSLVPIAEGGVYQTPTAAVSLEFVSSSASDALNSTGMHELTVVGLDASWNEQTVVTAAHATNGTTAVAISGTWLRVYRVFVSSSGAYATAATPSQIGTVTVRVVSGGATYAVLPQIVSGFGSGQSLIGAYTVPNGFTAYKVNQEFSSDISGTKTTDFFFFKRENADDVSTSYSGIMRISELSIGTQGTNQSPHLAAEIYPAKTDIGFMALASATTKASVSFELLLVAD